MSAQRFACGVEYHGGAFAGWQIQSHARSVEATLQQAISQVAAHDVALIAAGRTDAGVHALAQVVHFDTTASRSLRGWAFGVNGALPRDVSLRFVRPVPDHFHARYSAEARSYQYLIFNRRERSALTDGRACWQSRSLDAARMQAAAAHLRGTQDFSSFRAADCQSRSPMRHLEQLDVERHGEWIVVTATANAFLHHMVRNLVGLLMDIGLRRDDPQRAAAVLAASDRRLSGPTAPAEGLYLAAVRYPAAFALPPIRYHDGVLFWR